MTEWHDKVSQTLMLQARVFQARSAPPEPSTALSDYGPESSICSSVDDQSMVGAATYLSHTRPSSYLSNIHIPPRAIPPHSPHPYGPDEAPWSPEHRRNSVPPHAFPPRSPWIREGLTPTGSNTPTNHPRARPRSLSTTSTESSSSCSSTDSASSSPTYLRPPFLPPAEQRRHSSSVPNSPHNYPSPQNSPHHHHLQPSRPQTSYFPPQPPRPQDSPRPNARGLNVRWNNVNSVFQLPGSAPATPSEEIPGARPMDGRRERRRTAEGRRDGGRRTTSPLRGVRGRRYPAEGIAWR